MARVTGFPLFDDGNFNILINPDMYNLHGSVLGGKSRFFGAACAGINEPGQLGATRLVLVPSTLQDKGVFAFQVDLYIQGSRAL